MDFVESYLEEEREYQSKLKRINEAERPPPVTDIVSPFVTVKKLDPSSRPDIEDSYEMNARSGSSVGRHGSLDDYNNTSSLYGNQQMISKSMDGIPGRVASNNAAMINQTLDSRSSSNNSSALLHQNTLSKLQGQSYLLPNQQVISEEREDDEDEDQDVFVVDNVESDRQELVMQSTSFLLKVM